MTDRQRKYYIGLMLLCIALSWLPFDSTAGAQLTSMLKTTLAVYAVARGLNAVISVGQGTEVAIEPMGIGVTLAPGEALDPLNDLVEQVSSILLLASASIGVQKILLEIGETSTLRWGLVIIAVIGLLLVLFKNTPSTIRSRVVRGVLVLTLLRCLVPAMALVTHQLQVGLTGDRTQAVAVLKDTQADVDSATQTPDEGRAWYEILPRKNSPRQDMKDIDGHTEKATGAAVQILAEFALVFILVPLLMWFILVSVMKRLVAGVKD